MTDRTQADIQMIQRIIPHRYPFLLVDRVIDIDGTKSATGLKNVTMNEPHFQGHFPGTPIMPGVTVVEAMAQTSAVMVGLTMGLEDKDLLIYFMGIDKCKFRRKVVPGDVLRMDLTTLRGKPERFTISPRDEIVTSKACSNLLRFLSPAPKSCESKRLSANAKRKDCFSTNDPAPYITLCACSLCLFTLRDHSTR